MFYLENDPFTYKSPWEPFLRTKNYALKVIGVTKLFSKSL